MDRLTPHDSHNNDMSYEIAQLALSANVRAKSPVGHLVTVGQVELAVLDHEADIYEKVKAEVEAEVAGK